MNVFPPLTGRLIYYASPSDQRGWWGTGRGGVSMSDAPWHWLYKWLHLHTFHFPAHRSREELIGPTLIGDDWLQLGLPMHFDGLHIWQSPLPQWLNHAPLSSHSLIVGDMKVGSSQKIVLPAAQPPLWSSSLCASWLHMRKGMITSIVWPTDVEERRPLLLQALSDRTHDLRLLLWSVATGWWIRLTACCQLHNWRSETLLLACRNKSAHHAMFCSMKNITGNCASAEGVE